MIVISTIYDVAKEAGVSPSTVSRVLNNYSNVTYETEVKVKKACKKLDYIINANASNLKSGKTKTLAVFIPDIVNPFFTSVLKGFENKSLENRYNTIVCDTDESQEKELNYINMILEKRIEGVVIATVSKDNSHIKKIQDHGVPVVLLDRKIKNINADIICSNNREGAAKLVNHLINNGRKRIAIIAAPLYLSTSRERLEGYKKALEGNNIEVRDEFIKIDNESEGFSTENAYEMTKELLNINPRPDSIFVVNNLMAMEVYKALKEEGIEVPKDIAIVCFDDLNLVYEMDPFFTIMKQPDYTMGEVAAEVLIDRIEGNYNNSFRKVEFKSELIVRRSSLEK